MGEWDTSGCDVFPGPGSGVWSVDSSRSFVDQSNVHNSISVSSSAHAACTIPAVLYWLLRSAAAPCFVNIEISLRMTKPEQLGGGGQREEEQSIIGNISGATAPRHILLQLLELWWRHLDTHSSRRIQSDGTPMNWPAD